MNLYRRICTLVPLIVDSSLHIVNTWDISYRQVQKHAWIPEHHFIIAGRKEIILRPARRSLSAAGDFLML